MSQGQCPALNYHWSEPCHQLLLQASLIIRRAASSRSRAFSSCDPIGARFMPLPLVAQVPRWGSLADDSIGVEGTSNDGMDDVVGAYALRGKLGAGASGNVYKAEEVESGRQVALKLLHCSASLGRFVREAQLTCDLPPHPNLVSGLDWGESCGIHYLAMKYVRGHSLEEELMRGRLEWPVALEIALQVAGALDHLTRHGIVAHRDVKPSNILVSFEPSCVASRGEAAPASERRVTATLVDLGLASATSQACDDAAAGGIGSSSGAASAQTPSRLLRVRTPAFSSIGSPAFMAPEQVADARRADLRSDLYGLGATLYAAVTGRLPFDGASPAKVMQQVVEGDVRPPSAWRAELPRGVEALILWLLATRESERPGECEAGGDLVRAVEALRRAPHDVSIVQHAQRRAERRKSREERWRWLANAVRVLTIAASVVVVGIVLADLRPSDEPEPGGGAAGDWLDSAASSVGGAWHEPGLVHSSAAGTT